MLFCSNRPLLTGLLIVSKNMDYCLLEFIDNKCLSNQLLRIGYTDIRIYNYSISRTSCKFLEHFIIFKTQI